MGNEVNYFDKGVIIEGLTVTLLKRFSDERGAVLKFLQLDSPNFQGFGEAYFSLINESVVKGWKKHKKINQNFCVPHGEVMFVVYDDRKNSSTRGVFQKIILNNNTKFQLLSMPPGLWYSFKGLNKEYSILANIIDQPHTQEESENIQIDSNQIPYNWTQV